MSGKGSDTDSKVMELMRVSHEVNIDDEDEAVAKFQSSESDGEDSERPQFDLRESRIKNGQIKFVERNKTSRDLQLTEQDVQRIAQEECVAEGMEDDVGAELQPDFSNDDS